MNASQQQSHYCYQAIQPVSISCLAKHNQIIVSLKTQHRKESQTNERKWKGKEKVVFSL